MSIIAQGQLTIVDLNDLPSLIMSVGTNKQKVYTKNVNAVGTTIYTPTISNDDPMYLIPAIYKAGSNLNMFTTNSSVGDTAGRVSDDGLFMFKGWDIKIDGTTYTVDTSNILNATITALSNLGIKFITKLDSFGYKYEYSVIAITQNSAIGSAFTATAKIGYKYSALIAETNASADISISTIAEGSRGYTAYITNSNHLFPTKDSKFVVNSAPCVVAAEAYYGGERIVENCRLSATIPVRKPEPFYYSKGYLKPAYDENLKTIVYNEFVETESWNPPSTATGGNIIYIEPGRASITIGDKSETVFAPAAIRITPKEDTSSVNYPGGTIDFNIYVLSNTLTSTMFSTTQTLTWSSSGAGADGSSGVSYSLVLSTKQINADIDSDGKYTFGTAEHPKTIRIEPIKYTGESRSTVTDCKVAKRMTGYAWDFLTTKSDEGIYTDSLKESADNIDSIEYKLVGPSVTNTSDIENASAFDTETVFVYKPLKSHVAVSATTTDNIASFRNNSGENITINANVVVDGVLQNPNSMYTDANKIKTTDISWKKGTETVMDTGSTVHKGFSLTVTPTDVNSNEYFSFSFKYQGITYSDGIVITDYSDPISVEIQSSNGDKFVNKIGSTILTCVVRRSNYDGSSNDIDADGNTYKYTWSLIKSNGEIDTDFGAAGVGSKAVSGQPGTVTGSTGSFTVTGKKLYIDSSVIDVKGTVCCKVETKS